MCEKIEQSEMDAMAYFHYEQMKSYRQMAAAASKTLLDIENPYYRECLISNIKKFKNLEKYNGDLMAYFESFLPRE